MTASQIYDGELWDRESARTMRPLRSEERPVWMTESGEYDFLRLQEHLAKKYWSRSDMDWTTHGDTKLKCGDEVQVSDETLS